MARWVPGPEVMERMNQAGSIAEIDLEALYDARVLRVLSRALQQDLDLLQRAAAGVNHVEINAVLRAKQALAQLRKVSQLHRLAGGA